jgi:hypothetical protein
MPVAFKFGSRVIGILPLVLCALGIYLMSQSAFGVVPRHHNDPRFPYFWLVFIVMSVLSICLLTALVITAIRLIRISGNAVTSYCVVVGLCSLYIFIPGFLWLAPNPIGSSVAAASGIGDMGIAPFVFAFVLPCVYPFLSASVLFFFQKRGIDLNKGSV